MCRELDDVLAIVVAPVAVLVGEDASAGQGSEGLLLERPERIDDRLQVENPR